jgi:6-pyruvoyltetrahydropterin/6-carboxytetrahydropterin synthase
VTGPIDPETGYVIDLKILNDIIREKVVERFDHKNLYLDVEDFKDLNPSAENIAVKIWRLLRNHVDQKCDLEIELYETERNYVIYSGPHKKQ